MKINLKKIIWLFIIFIIGYIYIATTGKYFGFAMDFLSLNNHRAILLTLIVLLGVIYILFSKTLLHSRIIDFAGILALYMFCLGITTYEEFFSWISCSVMWFFIILVMYNLRLTEKEVHLTALFFSAVSILLSVIYIVGTMWGIVDSSVENINAIYYVLTVLPFVFVFPSTVIQIIALTLATAAAFLSGKSISLIIVITIWLIFTIEYLIVKKVKFFKFIYRLGILALAIGVAWYLVRQYIPGRSLSMLLSNIVEDFSGGASGRGEIYIKAWNAFTDSSILEQLIGHGFNAIDRKIRIGTHNDFLMVLYNYGILGLSLYLAFWIQLIKGVIKIKQDTGVFNLSYNVSIIVFFLISMSSNVLNTQIQFLLLCVFWGIYAPERISAYCDARRN